MHDAVARGVVGGGDPGVVVDEDVAVPLDDVDFLSLQRFHFLVRLQVLRVHSGAGDDVVLEDSLIGERRRRSGEEWGGVGRRRRVSE